MLRNIISNEIFLLFPKYQKKKKNFTRQSSGIVCKNQQITIVH